MKAQWSRYLLVAVFACLLGALAHASISRAVQGQGPDARAPRAARPHAPIDDRHDDRHDDERPHNTLLRRLWELIDQSNDLSLDEKSEAFEILEEADPILTSIKKENEEAIEILRNPPRHIVPKPRVKPDVEKPEGTVEAPSSEGPKQDEEV